MFWSVDPAAARCKTCVCGRSLAGIAISNPAKSVGAPVFFFVCRLLRMQRPLWRADHPSRGVLLSVCVYVCLYLIVCDLETSTRRRPIPDLSCCVTRKNFICKHVTYFLMLMSRRRNASKLHTYWQCCLFGLASVSWKNVSYSFDRSYTLSSKYNFGWQRWTQKPVTLTQSRVMSTLYVLH